MQRFDDKKSEIVTPSVEPLQGNRGSRLSVISSEAIRRGGSKLEITRALLEGSIDVPLPRSAWKYCGDDIQPLISAFHSMRKSVIVRGSHMNDYHGFIDVVPTIENVSTIAELEAAVRRIESELCKEEVRIHCEDWGQEYTPEVHILMQERSPSTHVGTMIRHSHSREIVVQYIASEQGDPFARLWDLMLLSDGCLPNGQGGTLAAELERLIQMYLTLETCGLLDPSFCQQVEFGLAPLMFFQARPFMKFQQEAAFQIPDAKRAIRSDMAFGITPPEGIKIAFESRTNDLYSFSPPVGPYGLIVSGKVDYGGLKMTTATRLGDLSVYCSPYGMNIFLSHQNYRPMKKAQISFVDATLDGKPLSIMSPDSLQDFAHGRVICNGRDGIILPRGD